MSPPAKASPLTTLRARLRQLSIRRELARDPVSRLAYERGESLLMWVVGVGESLSLNFGQDCYVAVEIDGAARAACLGPRQPPGSAAASHTHRPIL